MNGIDEISARAFARRTVPDSTFCTTDILRLARVILMYRLACLPATFVDDVVAPFVHDSAESLASETTALAPIAEEWCIGMCAFLSAQQMSNIVTACRVLKGCMRASTTRLGSLRLRDAVRRPLSLGSTVYQMRSLVRADHHIA